MKALYLLPLFLLFALPLVAQTGSVGIGTTTPQAQLHTTGTVRHDTLRGLGRRMVFADANGGLFSPVPPYPTNDSVRSIAANGCASGTGAVSTIVISGQPASVATSAIRVRVNINHPFDEDVLAYLSAPTGEVLNLIAFNGGSGDNFTNTVFTDAAAAGLPFSTFGAPFTNRFKPTGSQAALCGVTPTDTAFATLGTGGNINPNGAWTLRVYDQVQADAGTLLSWSISFTGTDPTFTPGGSTFATGVVPRGEAGGLVAGTIFDNGNIGIGTNTPNASLQLSNAIQNRKLVLYETANNDHQFYGFGINGGTLRYQTDAAGADHVFFSAAGPNSSTELMRIKGSGNVGIGTGFAGPNARLDVAGTTETDALRITAGGDTKDFAVKNDAAGNVGFRKGFGGLGMRYIIATTGCFPSQGSGVNAPLACPGDAMVGEVKLWSGNIMPNGWAECNGQMLAIATFPTLFSIIGTIYGGNGTTNFAVPDLRGAVPVGVGASVNNTWTEGQEN